ncbi:MAG: hemin ABC transporter substrate-binding protein [Rhodobiaceae bacterium]|nr:MAG: hemin ABC transporter substrate-binding protein [Rhodobiaceae bacterium]
MITRRTLLSLTGAGVGGVILPAAFGSGAWAVGQSGTLPSRIVSAGGAITETLFALGLEDRIVAVDTTSTYPHAAMALPKIGYLRQLSAEGLLSVRPDLVVLSSEAGPPAAIEQLKASGIPLVIIEAEWSPEGIARQITEVGVAVGAEEPALELASRVSGQFETLAATLPDVRDQKMLLLLSAGTGPLLAAGTNTAADAIMKLAGGGTALPDMEGYKPVSIEPILAADPDWIILPSHVARALGGHDGVSSLEVITRTRAGVQGRVAIIDSLYLLGFGIRTAQAAADLATLLYPDAGIPALGRPSIPSPSVMIAGAG